ncbi:unknown [Bacteroides sp. CAG:714]|jgi:hypothetical protein|nr:unknown [Bacteroides sp. CAG:714]
MNITAYECVYINSQTTMNKNKAFALLDIWYA